ncbi:MAG: TIGR03751 family conjugal transfer lipoprotein [Gammaproteobacteria bacterium]|nr:TIGR03751 family conjugal transfer lipoprotein [Gammaproteobacteria bacterium]
MKKIMKIKTVFMCSIVGAAVALTGCTTPGKNTIPPAGDMTMAQIYYKESGLSAPDATSSNVNVDGLTAARSTAPTGQADYQGQGASDLMALNSQFKTLPNPQIIVYVSPHLVTTGSNAQAPVPGYVTSFFMYPQTEFAMPYEHY